MKAKIKQKPKCFTWAHNVKMCLENGSFCRVWPDGRIAQFMNGDYMGNIDAVPDKMTEVPFDLAENLLPDCCK
jgi:hypothetical protein